MINFKKTSNSNNHNQNTHNFDNNDNIEKIDESKTHIENKKNNDYILVIGGSAIDIVGYSNNKLIPKDSNIGHIETSFGGVGRNISENLALLGSNIKFLSPVGNDYYGNLILEHSKKIGIDMEDAFIFDGEKTAVYLSVLDDLRDMNIAIIDMNIFDNIKSSHILSKDELLKNANLIVLDTNLPEDILAFILNRYSVPIFIDPISTIKTKKIVPYVNKIHLLKPNIYELEVLVGKKIISESDIINAGKLLLKRGLKELIVTASEKGAYYFKDDCNYVLKVTHPPFNIKNATGAGDAFIAAFTYAYFMHYSEEDRLKFSAAASILTLLSIGTINNNFNIKNINKYKVEVAICKINI